MSQRRITTSTGSIYLLDEEANTFERQPGGDSGPLYGDGRPIEYVALTGPWVGASMRVVYRTSEGNWKARITSAVIEIEELTTE